jgi:hypothetical protein
MASDFLFTWQCGRGILLWNEIFVLDNIWNAFYPESVSHVKKLLRLTWSESFQVLWPKFWNALKRNKLHFYRPAPVWEVYTRVRR